MKDFFKIYLWQTLSLITGFGTLFIVTPFLATNPYLFGVYSVVTAMTIFFSYADLGFLSAGIKYVSEAVIKNDRLEETKIVGFVTAVLATFVMLISLVVFIISFSPEILIKDLPNRDTQRIASSLLLIFSISSPLIIFQRSLQIIFNSRLKDYLLQRILTLFNIIKISSAFYFFSNGKYEVVGYFIFSQVCLLVAVIIGFSLIRSKFNYSIVDYFKAIKFKKEIFYKIKSLAFSSLILTLGWVLFYELDLFVIGKFIGAKEVALFSICLAVMTFLRSIYAIFYNPFTAKFNHYIGSNELDLFNKTFTNILILGLPLMSLPPIILFFTMDSFILSWVGISYVESIPLISTMVLGYLFVFVSNPSGIALMAHLKIRELYWSSLLMPVIFWLIVSIGYTYMGLASFAFGKLIVFIVLGVYYSVLIQRFFNVNIKVFILKNILPFCVVIGVLYVIIFFNKQLLPNVKGDFELILYISIIGILYLTGLFLSYFIIKPFRTLINTFFFVFYQKYKLSK